MEGRPNMAKYYVQSGDRKMVMTAADSQAAALWLVHRSLNDVVTAYDDRGLSAEDRCEIAMVHGLIHLDNTIAVSEQGFDRSDSVQLDVFELIQTWHQLMTALIKLESDLL